MTRAEFATALGRLRAGAGPSDENPGSYRSTDCEQCIRCMFCQGCRSCYRCTHCIDSTALTGSAHCIRCASCHDCSHCEDSEGCMASQYLFHCSGCTECTYCYGCVGLTKKEFHILNQPYSRQDYFALIKKLRADPDAQRQ